MMWKGMNGKNNRKMMKREKGNERMNENGVE